ncbi:membrane domain protein [Escherichia coli]|uniref:membrane domain protein n=1 Tax=Escherichia coli TaxID=562 RepID=UPI0040691353
MLVDIDRKERAEEILVWIFFGAVWPLGIMFAATFLLMWIFTLPVISIEKKPDIDTIAAGA